MPSPHLIAFITFIATFLFAFINFYLISKTSSPAKKDTQASILAFFLIAVSSGILSFIIPTNDFLFDLNPIEPITMLCLTLAAFITYSWKKTSSKAWILPILSAAILYFFLPDDAYILSEQTYIWLNKLIICTLFGASCFLFKYINGIEGLSALQAVTIGFGIYMLTFFDAVPMLLGLTSLGVAGTFLALFSFNVYPARLNISNSAAASMGVFLSWMLVKCGQEASFPNASILAMFFLIEAAIAVAKKFSLLEKYQNIYANTFSYRANIKGLPSNIIISSVVKISILMIVLNCLQVYSPNPFSIPLLAALIMLWFLNKLVNWDTPKQTLKEMNKGFVQDIKDGLSNVKKMIDKD